MQPHTSWNHTTTPTEKSTVTLREKVLQDAARIVVGDRDTQYGGPEDSFRVIASMWTAHLREKYGSHVIITPADVSLMMCLMKCARLSTGGMEQDDTWTDIIGYAACGYEVQRKGRDDVQ